MKFNSREEFDEIKGYLDTFLKEDTSNKIIVLPEDMIIKRVLTGYWGDWPIVFTYSDKIKKMLNNIESLNFNRNNNNISDNKTNPIKRFILRPLIIAYFNTL